LTLADVGKPYDPALADYLVDPKLLTCTKPEVDLAGYSKQLAAAKEGKRLKG